MMLTIFTIPKAFHGHIALIQRNAIQSWIHLNPKPEIILFGDDEGVAEAAKEFGVLHVPEIRRTEYGTPIMNDIFVKARVRASTPFLGYLNADIILFNDLYEAIRTIPFEKFVMVGQRFNLDVTEPLDFQDPDWEKKLRERAKKSAVPQGPGATDYFIYPRELEWEMPPLIVGRGWTDIWMLYRTYEMGIPLIDATPLVYDIHQNHDYTHICQPGPTFRGIEEQHNFQLLGGRDYVFGLEDATHRVTSGGLQKKKWSKKRLLRAVYVKALLSKRSAIRTVLMELFRVRWWADYFDHVTYRRKIKNLFHLFIFLLKTKNPGA